MQNQTRVTSEYQITERVKVVNYVKLEQTHTNFHTPFTMVTGYGVLIVDGKDVCGVNPTPNKKHESILAQWVKEMNDIAKEFLS